LSESLKFALITVNGREEGEHRDGEDKRGEEGTHVGGTRVVRNDTRYPIHLFPDLLEAKVCDFGTYIAAHLP
jgi:hypothetical protein